MKHSGWPIVLASVWAAGSVFAQSPPASMAALPLETTAGHGATVPFIEYEAENAITDGVIIGPDRTFGSLPAEASGRRAIRLEGLGQAVTIVLDAPANALTVRYAVPDASDCRSGDTGLRVVADGKDVGRLALTPCYGWFYGDYPFTNDVSDSGGHHVFDHARLLLDETLPAGARLSIVMDSASPAPWIVVDLIDVEYVGPPADPPAGALSVLAFGADPTGVETSLPAFENAVAAGRRQGRPVWIPAGRYRIDGHLVVDQVTLIGAGPWHSILQGQGVGVFGRKAPHGSRNVVLRDFAIIGEVMDRDDHAPLNGVGGALNQSLISNLFIQHTKVGLWLDGPFDGLTATGLRIFDQTADAVNFHGGVTNSVVENTFVRGTGDDGLAMWSHRTPNAGNAFRNNTVIAPVLANGIAIYGGRDLTVSGNIVADTVTRGGGLHLGARFDATAFQGDILLEDNIVVRSGSIDPVWRHGVGAVWLYALDRPITEARVTIRDTLLIDSTETAFQVLGRPIEGVTIEDADVRGAGAGVIQIRSPGEVRLIDVRATGLGSQAVETHDPSFRLVDGGGNRGWTVLDRTGP